MLVVLAIGAVLTSLLGLPMLWTGHAPVLEHFMATVFEPAEHLPKVFTHGEGHGVEWLLMLASVSVATLGLGVSWWLYRGRTNPLPEQLLAKFPRLHRVIYNKYYVDEIYQASFVRGFMLTSEGSSWFDSAVIDRTVNLVGKATNAFRCVRRSRGHLCRRRIGERRRPRGARMRRARPTFANRPYYYLYRRSNGRHAGSRCCRSFASRSL